MTVSETKPLVPAVTFGVLDLHVDVLTDGMAVIGRAEAPAAGALFQFEYRAVLIFCDEGFLPEVGSPAATFYLDGKPWGDEYHRSEREFERGGVLYHLELFADDDDCRSSLKHLSKFMIIHYSLQGRLADSAFIPPRVALLERLVEHHLKQRKFTKQVVYQQT